MYQSEVGGMDISGLAHYCASHGVDIRLSDGLNSVCTEVVTFCVSRCRSRDLGME